MKMYEAFRAVWKEDKEALLCLIGIFIVCCVLVFSSIFK
jgi:hypothetical protein